MLLVEQKEIQLFQNALAYKKNSELNVRNYLHVISTPLGALLTQLQEADSERAKILQESKKANEAFSRVRTTPLYC